MRYSLSFEYEFGWTSFLASGTPEKWISRGKRLKNDLEFPQTGHRKFKMGCSLLFESKMSNTVFLACGTPQKWISRGKRLKNDFQGQPADLQYVKNVLPCTSQIWRHQLLATPLLLDWSMMRNIHSPQIFTAWLYKPPEHSPLGSLLQCCLKKKTKNTGPYFLNNPRMYSY